jgi:LAO/AO transport system kinase
MEIPDVIVVNKEDHPLTDSMVREIRGVLALGPESDWNVPVVRTEATEGSGVDELAELIDAHHAQIEQAGTLEERRHRNLMREVLGLATVRMRRQLEQSLMGEPEVRELLERVARREVDPASAAELLLERQRGRAT